MARILFSIKQQHSTVLISIKQSLSEALRGWPSLQLFSFLTYLKWPTQQQLCILFKPSLVYRQPPIRENNGSVCVAGLGNHTETSVEHENLRSMSMVGWKNGSNHAYNRSAVFNWGYSDTHSVCGCLDWCGLDMIATRPQDHVFGHLAPDSSSISLGDEAFRG